MHAHGGWSVNPCFELCLLETTLAETRLWLQLVVAKFSSKSEHGLLGNSESETKKIETDRESNGLGSQESSLC